MDKENYHRDVIIVSPDSNKKDDNNGSVENNISVRRTCDIYISVHLLTLCILLHNFILKHC